MIVAHSTHRRPKKPDAAIADILSEVSADKLHAYVDMLAFPRHYVAEHKANTRARDLLLKCLDGFGYAPLRLQGRYDNIVVTSGGAERGPYVLFGAHYDSVPGTPGADDNGSAVAACLEVAAILK